MVFHVTRVNRAHLASGVVFQPPTTTTFWLEAVCAFSSAFFFLEEGHEKKPVSGLLKSGAPTLFKTEDGSHVLHPQ